MTPKPSFLTYLLSHNPHYLGSNTIPSSQPSKQLSIIGSTIPKIFSSVISQNFLKRTQSDIPGRKMASVTNLKNAIHDWINK